MDTEAKTGVAEDRLVGGYLLRRSEFRDFRLLWGGQSVSRVGSQVSLLAIPLVALRYLDATTIQVAALTAASTASVLVFGLPAGVWIDRLQPRRAMILADLARLLALISIPVAHALGELHLLQLYLVAFASGLSTVFFDVGSQSYLPSLVGRQHLVEANAKLAGSAQVALVAGPSLADGLVQAIGAVYAVVADAASYLVSAVLISMAPNPAVAPSARAHESLKRQVAEGLRFVFTQPLFRAIAIATVWSNFFGSLIVAVGMVFLVRVLHTNPGVIGLLFAAGSLGGVLMALTASRITRLLGTGGSLIGGLALTSGLILLPLASPGLGLLWWAAGSFCYTSGFVLYNVTQTSLRQRLCPPELLGRMNATMQSMLWTVLTIGTLTGGAIGAAIGVRLTLLIGAAGSAVALVWLVASPARNPNSFLDAAKQPQ